MIEEESKIPENLRYLGWTLGVFGGMILVGLLYLILAPLLDIIMLIISIGAIVFFIMFVIAAVFYLFIAKKE